MKDIPSINGIILAGGKSSRMKCDKAFLKIGSGTMIEALISRLKKKFLKIMIITNDTGKYLRFEKRGPLEVVKDILPAHQKRPRVLTRGASPGKGPLGGIYTGLVKSDSFYNFIFACDMPFVNLDLIEYMINKAKMVDVIVPKWKGRFEPLHAIYSKNCVMPIERQLLRNDLKITNLFSEVKVRVIGEKELGKFNLGSPSFMNINTKRDYQVILEERVNRKRICL